MRIIAGEFRGRTIKAPKGEGTRPTTDRVRESLMSSVNSARGGFEGAVVLDAFAGSGALGLEALSRGAANARFCERDGAAFKVVCANVEAVSYTHLDVYKRQVLDGDLLHVGTEHAVRHAVRVADVAPCDRVLSANFANFRHRYHSRFVLFPHG